MLIALKDSALSLALKAYLNEKFREYGEVIDCEVDTVAGCIRLHARLRGETDSVSAAVEHYEIRRQSDGVYIVLHRFSASREWLAKLLTLLFADKRYALPAAVAALL